MAGGGGNLDGGEPEFQIAPMIDVLLVLLIFFMTITSTEVLRLDQDIQLPVAEDARKREKERGEVIVNIRWQEATRRPLFSLDQKNFTTVEEMLPDVKKAVDLAKANIQKGWNPHVRLVLRGDGRLPAIEVNKVVGIMADAGIADIAFSAASKN